MERQREGKVEQHERKNAADRGDEREDDRQRQDLASEEGVTSAGKGDESLQRVVFELAVEGAHRGEDRRERERQPEERGGDVGIACDSRAGDQALEQHEHGDERDRRDDPVRLPPLGPELANRDEADAVELPHPGFVIPRSIAICDAAKSSSSRCACVATTTIRPSSRARPIASRRRVTPRSSRSANGSSSSRTGTCSVSTRASEARRRSPAESFSTGRSRAYLSPQASSAAATPSSARPRKRM